MKQTKQQQQQQNTHTHTHTHTKKKQKKKKTKKKKKKHAHKKKKHQIKKQTKKTKTTKKQTKKKTKKKKTTKKTTTTLLVYENVCTSSLFACLFAVDGRITRSEFMAYWPETYGDSRRTTRQLFNRIDVWPIRRRGNNRLDDFDLLYHMVQLRIGGNYNTVKCQWLEYQWHVYRGWYELVFGSLGKCSVNSRKRIIRDIYLNLLIFAWKCMLYVLIEAIITSRKHTYIILTPLNPTFT